MTVYEIVERIEQLAQQITVDDPQTAGTLLVVAGALLEGHEDELSELLASYAEHRIRAIRARDN
jgi:hypothetical protein